jgi:hypothetical protein
MGLSTIRVDKSVMVRTGRITRLDGQPKRSPAPT